MSSLEEETAKYRNYISEIVRYALKIANLKMLPDNTIIITQTYSKLAKLDSIIGLPIYVCNVPTSYEFFISFPSKDENNYKLQNAFQEALNIIEEGN